MTIMEAWKLEFGDVFPYVVLMIQRSNGRKNLVIVFKFL
ncbi:hypothetical protein MJ1HA_0439 [Metallosphaera sedula]|nr:hypothetical protein MJ1HA_0439 [Metallosphaera sedula]